MRKYRKMEEDLNKEFNSLKENLNQVQKQSKNFIVINEKRLENFNKLDEIIEDIDKEFAKKTGIFNKKDQTFLWTAVALQTLRWYLLEYDFGEWKINENYKNERKSVIILCEAKLFYLNRSLESFSDFVRLLSRCADV